MQISASLARGELQLGKGFLFHRHDGHVVPETASALKRQEGKPAVAGDETYAGHRFVSLSNGLGPSRTDASGEARAPFMCHGVPGLPVRGRANEECSCHD